MIQTRGLAKSLATKALIVFVMVLAIQCTGAAQLSIDQLLKKVSETYQSAQNYQISAEKDVEVGAVGEAHSLDGSRSYANFHQSSKFDINFAATAQSRRRLTVKDEKQETVIVDDGRTSWTYLSGKKQYKEEPSVSPGIASQAANKVKTGTDILSEYQNLLVNRFRNLSGYASSSTLEKDERIKIGGEKKDCYHVRIQTAGGSHDLWIDKDSFLVWRSKDSTPTPQEGITLQTTVTVTLKAADLNAKFEDGFFTFKPPEQAKKVDSIKL